MDARAEPGAREAWPGRWRRLAPRIALAAVLAAALLYVVAGAGLALALGPEPHSDWLHYWRSAGDPAFYERGGLGVWLLAIPKALGVGPVGSALALNLPAGLALLALAWRADRTRSRLLALLSAAYLVLLAPYAGIVQLDLLAALFVAASAVLLLRPPRRWPARASWVAAVACLAAGVSVKPQYALLAWAMLGLLALPWLWWRRREGAAGALVGLLLAGSLLGFAADNGLRELSGRGDRLRTSSAVTLYGGLLVSRMEGCGYWSVEAAEAAVADMGKPLAQAVRDRLSAQPPAHWFAIMACKWPQILRPPPYALYWLVESPNVRARIEASPDRDRLNARYHRAIDLERRAYGLVTALVLLAAAAGAALAWRRGARVLALLPLAWVGAFWGVHLVFEIQGRYFLGLFLLAPMLVGLVLRPARRPGGVESPARSRPAPEPDA